MGALSARSPATEDAHRLRDMSDGSTARLGSEETVLGGAEKVGGGFKSCCWLTSRLPEIEELEGQELKRKRSAYKAAERPKSAHYPD